MNLIKYLPVLLLLIVVGCTTDAPRMTAINGHTVVQTDQRFIGMKVRTKSEVVKTKDQLLDDLEVQKEEREQDLDLKAEERQSLASFLIGLALLIAAPACVIMGYVSSGWKFWGTMATICGTLGSCFWLFEHLIPYFEKVALGIPVAVILWTMWKLKDFNLLERLKKSEPGKLI